ncbi:M24 family metallopeptidase [Paenibacillus spongiae]|uniref:Xaa-Pro peptidase family protein n=1 Tax=Paenibacillus spongiae TaxID=2909671 RepID=A0ABY5S4A1_9BACL|nr:Xaa-Pro peptidase family protein [Paenibacillus spongiae]UVI28534.1 Xaa-Pro peptidase family protein [Paenibacillus spongiae]
MQPRIQALYEYMNDQSMDALLVTLPAHIFYLTGFRSEPHERFLGLVLVKGESPFLLVPAIDLEAAQAAANHIPHIHTHSDTDNPYEVLSKLLPRTIGKFGLEKSHLTVSRFEALTAACGAREYADIDEALRAMRVIKSTEEIIVMRRAVRMIEDVLQAGIAHVRPGVSELDLVAELDYRMKKLGADGPSFDTMVLAGEKSALPHGIPGDRKVQNGELLLFDLGVYLDGYASDITRTFAVGDIDDKLKDIYETVLAANRKAIEAVRPGVTLASLDRAARDTIASRGYGEYFMHRLGHGLGLDVHEYPSVHGQNEERLAAGMAFTIEPGVYVAGLGGVRIEDDVIVTEDGVEVLTSFPKELTVIG